MLPVLPSGIQHIDGRDARFPLPQYDSGPLTTTTTTGPEPGEIRYRVESIDGRAAAVPPTVGSARSASVETQSAERLDELPLLVREMRQQGVGEQIHGRT